MKVEIKKPQQVSEGHSWASTVLVMVGLGVIALAVFWIRRCRKPLK